jgi:hypothetical protein
MELKSEKEIFSNARYMISKTSAKPMKQLEPYNEDNDNEAISRNLLDVCVVQRFDCPPDIKVYTVLSCRT